MLNIQFDGVFGVFVLKKGIFYRFPIMAIRGNADPLLGREDAVGQARAIDALYRSAVSGTAASL